MELPDPTSDDRTLGGCRCDGGQLKNFARPCLLLLLAETSAHGSELMDRLKPFGFDVADPPSIYRTVRQREDEKLLTSWWDTSNRGPACRLYAITSDGLDLLAAWTRHLEQSRESLGLFLGRYGTLVDTPRHSPQPPDFSPDLPTMNAHHNPPHNTPPRLSADDTVSRRR